LVVATSGGYGVLPSSTVFDLAAVPAIPGTWWWQLLLALTTFHFLEYLILLLSRCFLNLVVATSGGYGVFPSSGVFYLVAVPAIPGSWWWQHLLTSTIFRFSRVFDLAAVPAFPQPGGGNFWWLWCPSIF